MLGLDVAGFVAVAGAVYIVLLLPRIFFLSTLQSALSACSPGSRMMYPSMVWLWLIPNFDWIWQFIVVGAVSDSVENELVKRQIEAPPGTGRPIGFAMCVCSVLVWIPVIGVLLSLASFGLWIVYWIAVHGIVGTLERSRA